MYAGWIHVGFGWKKKEKNPRTHTRKVITKTVKSKRIMNYIA